MTESQDSKLQNESSSSRKAFDLRVPGRIVLNVWRFMKHEVGVVLGMVWSEPPPL